MLSRTVLNTITIEQIDRLDRNEEIIVGYNYSIHTLFHVVCGMYVDNLMCSPTVSHFLECNFHLYFILKLIQCEWSG